EKTVEALRPSVSAGVEPSNPVDVGGPGLFDEAAFASGLRAVADDPGVSCVLVTLNAWYSEHTRRFVDAAIAVAASSTVPVVPVWMSERRGEEHELLDAAGVPAIGSVVAGSA